MKSVAQAGLHLHIAPDNERMSRRAASEVLRVLRERPDALLGLATGGSPTRTYALLAVQARRHPELFRAVRIVKLDEWGGLPVDHPATCEHYLKHQVLGPWGIPVARYCGWESRPARPAAECARVAAGLRRHGPLDLCILGLGLNGHILLNEPADALDPMPHVARLAPESLRHGMLASTGARPRYGLTVGFGDLLRSREILMLVSGAAKARQLQRMLRGRVTTRFPASLLRLHGRLTVVCDRDAARWLT